MTEAEVRKAFEDLTGLDEAGIVAFEAKVNETIQSTLDYIGQTNGDADTTHVYEFIRDNYEGAELILFASQMLSEVIQMILNDRRQPDMADLMAMMLSDKLERDLSTGHVAVKGDA